MNYAYKKFRSYVKIDPKLVRYLRQAHEQLSFVSRVFAALPSRDDNVLTKCGKCVNVVDMFVDHFVDINDDPHEYLATQNLNRVVNRPFVDMLLNTSLRELFEFKRIKFDRHVNIIVAKHATGNLYLIERAYSTATIDGKFWCDAEFDFERVLSFVWNAFENRIHVDQDKQGTFEYVKIPDNNDPYCGTAAIAKFAEFIAQHKTYCLDGVPRTYLFYGKPGSGKSVFAERLSLTGGRTIRLASSSMATAEFRQLSFVFDGLKPDFLIVDDIDRNASGSSVSTLLNTFEMFKRKYPNMTMILTVNDVSKLDAALLRPGRIDEIVEFEPPDERARQEIIKGYLEQLRVDVKNKDLARVVDLTDGLTPAYLKEVALQLKYKSIENVCNIISKMIELSENCDSSDDTESEEYYDDEETGGECVMCDAILRHEGSRVVKGAKIRD